MTEDNKIREFHLAFAEERGTDKTYCPSEVAKKVAPTDWRRKMDKVREVADRLVKAGDLIVLQKGCIIKEKPSKAKGPIRLGKPRN